MLSVNPVCFDVCFGQLEMGGHDILAGCRMALVPNGQTISHLVGINECRKHSSPVFITHRLQANDPTVVLFTHFLFVARWLLLNYPCIVTLLQWNPLTEHPLTVDARDITVQPFLH